MNDIWLFVLGALIFGGYLFGLLSMINGQHKIQERQDERYKRAQEMKTPSGPDAG